MAHSGLLYLYFWWLNMFWFIFILGRNFNSTFSWIWFCSRKMSLKQGKYYISKWISIWNLLIGKTGLPLQNFRLSREFSSGTNQKIVYNLHHNRNFPEFVVNGKQSVTENCTINVTSPNQRSSNSLPKWPFVRSFRPKFLDALGQDGSLF